MNEDFRRRFAVAVNAEALALAWARQETAPAGAVVVVDHEISPRGRLGRLWPHPPERTAVLATVWRPALDVEGADLVWLGASLGLLSAAGSLASGDGFGLWWPDGLVDGEERRVGEVRAEVQLGPGRVRSAIVTARIDLEAVGHPERDAALAAVVQGLDIGVGLLDAGPAVVRAAYAERCILTGRRVTARLLPRGAARGTVRGVDACGRLELVSATGLVERVSVDVLDGLEVSPGSS